MKRDYNTENWIKTLFKFQWLKNILDVWVCWCVSNKKSVEIGCPSWKILIRLYCTRWILSSKKCFVETLAFKSPQVFCEINKGKWTFNYKDNRLVSNSVGTSLLVGLKKRKQNKMSRAFLKLFLRSCRWIVHDKSRSRSYWISKMNELISKLLSLLKCNQANVHFSQDFSSHFLS